MSTDSLADIISGAGETDAAVKLLCTRCSNTYASFLTRLSSKDGAPDTDDVLRAILSLRPSSRLSPIFSATPAPVLLLLAPSALHRAAVLLADPHADLHCAGTHWRDASAVAIAARRALLATEGRRLALLSALPPWLPAAEIQIQMEMEMGIEMEAEVGIGIGIGTGEVADAPPPPLDGECLSAGNFAAVLHVVACGLAHLFHDFSTAGDAALLAGAGTLELLHRALGLMTAPAVIGCGAKERCVQTAGAALLLGIRAALERRKGKGENSRRALVEQWEAAVRVWFDLATQCSNIVCVQLLFPYIMSL